jgi:hypothetical protein
VSEKLLAKALVLCKSRVRSLSTIIDETSIETNAQEYDAAYDQLLSLMLVPDKKMLNDSPFHVAGLEMR